MVGLPSNSMVPTLQISDHIFAVKGPMRGPIAPGMVVVHRGDQGPRAHLGPHGDRDRLKNAMDHCRRPPPRGAARGRLHRRPARHVRCCGS
jgi:signal peptidase I